MKSCPSNTGAAFVGILGILVLPTIIIGIIATDEIMVEINEIIIIII